MHEMRRRNGQPQPDQLYAELRRIEALQRKWNALTFAERAMIARVSPDLTLFFQPRRFGTQATATAKSNNAADAAAPAAG